MSLRVLLAALLSIAVFGSTEHVFAATDSLVAVRAARWLDVETGVVREDALVLVRGGKIEGVGSSKSLAVPAGASLLDLGDVTLLPGLIDAHVHLLIGGRPKVAARATLQAGFTTVQDLGALGGASLRVRDSIATGAWVGPRVLAAGPWIGVAKGTCDFDGRQPPDAAGLLVASVDSAVAAGADLIKICVGGWVEDAYARPDSLEISPFRLYHGVAKAHRLGRRVFAHAIGAEAAYQAVQAGVDGLAHAAFVDTATARAMRTRSVWMLSTLGSFEQLPQGPGRDALLAHFSTLVKAGAPIALGTDAGVVTHGENAKELEALVRHGMTPIEALRAATVNAAAAVGLGDRIGTIAPGKDADLIAVRGDPTEDLAALRDVAFVMQLGRVKKGLGP